MTSKVLAIMNNNNQYNIDNLKDNKPGRKFKKPKRGHSAKIRRTDDYWLNVHNKERRKQTKVSYNQTHRQEEQPDPKDKELEDIYFANAMGCSKLVIDGKMPFSAQPAINIKMVDSFVQRDEAGVDECPILNQLQQARLEEEEWTRDYDDYNYDVEPRWSPSDDEFEYDEEQDREDNYTKLVYDAKQYRYRIWKPIAGHTRGGRFVCESDDENSRGSCF